MPHALASQNLVYQRLEEDQRGKRTSARTNRDICQAVQPRVSDSRTKKVDVEHAPRTETTRELPRGSKSWPGGRVVTAAENEPSQYGGNQADCQRWKMIEVSPTSTPTPATAPPY